VPWPDLIVFDCDSVVIDSEIIACRVEAEALTKAGYPIDAAGVAERFMGRPTRVMLATVEAELGRPLPASYETEVRRRKFEVYARELRAIPGVRAVLDRLRDRLICVASSSRPETIGYALGLTGLYDRFAPRIYSTVLVERGKPAPDLFLHAARECGVAPKRCAVIEDSVPGVQAGLAAGMTVFGFAGGSHCPLGHGERLRTAGVTLVFDDMTRLPELLDRMAARSGRARSTR
jgi:HAD superfamily hydrolase (TIGR01509 family)